MRFHFPTVEVDAYFYAIQPRQNVEKWTMETPECFQFIVKAYQGMTGHQRGDIPYASKEEMFTAFLQSIEPFQQANKLAMVLFQFPPWFDCQKSMSIIYVGVGNEWGMFLWHLNFVINLGFPLRFTKRRCVLWKKSAGSIAFAMNRKRGRIGTDCFASNRSK